MSKASTPARRLAARLVAWSLVAVGVAVFWVQPVVAHPMSFGSVRLEMQALRLQGDLALDVPQAVLAQPDAARRGELAEQIRRGLRIETAATVLAPLVVVRQLGHGDNAVDVAEVSFALPPGTERVRFATSDAMGDLAIELVDAARGLRERSVVPGGTESRWIDLSAAAAAPTATPSATAASASELPNPPSAVEADARSFLDYSSLGFHHIVPEGVDHLLFVLSLVFLVDGWAALFLLLSVFTVGHTLSVATTLFAGPSLASAWVEPLIALSLAYAAVEERRPHWSRLRALVVICFGLVHGLGFAGALGQVRVPKDERVLALVGFNAGVELGQILVAGLAFALLVWCKRRWKLTTARRHALRGIATVGIGWAVLRVIELAL